MVTAPGGNDFYTVLARQWAAAQQQALQNAYGQLNNQENLYKYLALVQTPSMPEPTPPKPAKPEPIDPIKARFKRLIFED